MANMGMLTLSNNKDGRGLFWVGMDNMDALEKEFDWVDFKGCSDVKEKEYYIGDLDERNYAIKHINRLLQEPMATPGTDGEEEDEMSSTPPPPPPPKPSSPKPPTPPPAAEPAEEPEA